jgi:hypothetical protein
MPETLKSGSKKDVVPASAVATPSSIKNVVPRGDRNARPIGIGVAIVAVLMAYGLIQIIHAQDKTLQSGNDVEAAATPTPTAANQAGNDAKLAAQKSANEAKPLAEKQKVARPATANTPAEPKTGGIQKLVQNEPHSYRDSERRARTASQSVNHPAPVARVSRPSAPSPRFRPQPAVTEKAPDPFKGTAPGG